LLTADIAMRFIKKLNKKGDVMGIPVSSFVIYLILFLIVTFIIISGGKAIFRLIAGLFS